MHEIQKHGVQRWVVAWGVTYDAVALDDEREEGVFEEVVVLGAGLSGEG